MNKIALPVLLAACMGSSAASAAEGAEGAAQSIQFHGYHETHANIILDGSRTLDPHRTVLGMEARLSERILFSFELDFEHAFEEPELEFAEVVGHISDNFDLVGGTMLMPFGSLNETHEPPFFYSVERPLFHRDFAPTSWQDVGAGFRASFLDGEWKVRGALVNGFDAFAVDGTGALNFKGSVREMKQKARFANFQDVAGILRTEWAPALWLKLGVSAYAGGADQHREDSLQVQYGMAEFDAKARIKSLEVRMEAGAGAFAGEYFDRQDVDGPRQAAAGVELAWHQALPKDQDLVPFARFEYFDHDAAGDDPTAYLAYTAGLAWYPIPQLALKADFMRVTSRNPRQFFLNNDADLTGDLNQINLGIGLIYP